MPEPSTEETEPVSDVIDDKTEPVDEEIEEPASEDVDDSLEDEDQEEKFMDPKTLPPELQIHFKKMQATFTKAMQGLKDKPAEEPSDNDEPSTPDEELDEFIQSPEGKLMERAFDHFSKTKLGDLFQMKESVEQEKLEKNVDLQIDEAIKIYGAENIKAHQAEINQIIEKNKEQGIYIPLQYICASVLYPKAKESGKSEVRQEIRTKATDSNINKGSSSSPVNISDRPVNTLRDAFNQALEESS